jgi:hypothetical protein
MQTAQIRLAVAARDHDSECPIRCYAARRIDQISTADALRVGQQLRLPDTCAVTRGAAGMPAV